MNTKKEKLKIKFVDFWGDLNNSDNIFYNILSQNYEIEFSDTPEIIFYSNYGKEHLNFRCIRIFFSGENVRPNYNICDFAISFDHLNNNRHCRFPLWAFYYWTYLNCVKLPKLDTSKSDIELLKAWAEKKKFCCFIVSNPKGNERNNFFEALGKRKFVDSVGKFKNNVGYFLEGGTLEKLEFIKDYKFVISFENASHEGYTTEKILEPLLANCIPIYWGDPKVNNDFNPRRFINYSSYLSEKDVIDKIIKIDNDDNLAIKILEERCFTHEQQGLEKLEKDLTTFLLTSVSNRKNISPKAKNLIFVSLVKTEIVIKKIKNKIEASINKVLSIKTSKCD